MTIKTLQHEGISMKKILYPLYTIYTQWENMAGQNFPIGSMISAFTAPWELEPAVKHWNY